MLVLRPSMVLCVWATTIIPSACLAASLVERLGFASDAKVLIINCDDFGMSHGENQATMNAIANGVATSATLMVPCPWILEALEWANQRPDPCVGVHLTLTSEWKRFRWGPVLGREVVPSLVDEQGYLYRGCEGLWQHADPDEVYRECRAQVERALALGLNPTHLDNHMGSLQTHPEWWRVYFRLAREFNLPLRLASRELYLALGAGDRRAEYEQAGILGPDVLIYGDYPLPEPDRLEEVPAYYEALLRWLRPGTVTELYLHCALDGAEMQAISGSHARRQLDHDWLVSPDTRKLIDDLGIKLISYLPIRDLQRSAAK